MPWAGVVVWPGGASRSCKSSLGRDFGEIGPDCEGHPGRSSSHPNSFLMAALAARAPARIDFRAGLSAEPSAEGPTLDLVEIVPSTDLTDLPA